MQLRQRYSSVVVACYASAYVDSLVGARTSLVKRWDS